MNSLLLGLIIFSMFGIFMLTTQSFGNSLDTPSDVNKIGALQISDSSGETLLGLNLGTSDDISSVTLTFNTDIPNNSVLNISLKDSNGVEIGSGSTTVSPASTSVIINLSNTVTDAERSTLENASITIT